MKRTIAFISEHASPLAVLGGVDSGGQNVYVAETCRQLAAEGHNVDVFTRKDNYELPEVFNWLPGVRVIHITAGPACFIAKENLLPLMDDFAAEMLSFIMQYKMHYDIVHAHFFMSALVASKIKTALKIPYAVTFHALGLVRKLHQQEADGFPEERCGIEKFIIKDTDAIIAECPQDKEDLVKLYNADEDKITVIPCGFNSEEFYAVNQQEARYKLGLNPYEFIILQLGRMVPRKGVDNVIEALCKINTNRQVKLLIVGGAGSQEQMVNDPEMMRLQNIAYHNKVSAKVLFTGRKDRNLLHLYYSAADVFVSTPWYEPFGITPLEAMACRLPVIGANVGGIKYSVIHNTTGFLVPPRNPVALADKLHCLINDKGLRLQMGSNGWKRVSAYFTWKKITTELLNVYNEVCTGPSANFSIPRFVSLQSKKFLLNHNLVVARQQAKSL